MGLLYHGIEISSSYLKIIALPFTFSCKSAIVEMFYRVPQQPLVWSEIKRAENISLTRKDKSLGDHMVSQAYFFRHL